MRRLLTTAMLSLLCASPAFAATRSLLTPVPYNVALKDFAPAQNTLNALRELVKNGGTARVIVGVRVTFAPENALEKADLAKQRYDIFNVPMLVFRRSNIARQNVYFRPDSIPFFAAVVNSKQLEDLASDTNVISILEDGHYRASQTGTPSSTSAASYAVSTADSTALINAPAAGSTPDGDGQVIAVISDGVDSSNAALTSKVAAERCTGNCGTVGLGEGTGAARPARTDDIRGTMSAVVAAGTGGVAKKARVIAVNATTTHLNGDRYIYRSAILKALDYVYGLRSKYKIAAIDLTNNFDASYLGTTACDGQLPAEWALVANLKSAGIATVADAGADAKTDSLAYPACLSNVVSVAAVSPASTGSCEGTAAVDKVLCTANTAPALSLFAPGAVITKTANQTTSQSFGGWLGASHVAGAFALLKQKYPNDSVDDNLDRLRIGGKQLADYRAPATVKPRIDIKPALDISKVVTLVFNVVDYPIAMFNGTGQATFKAGGISITCSGPCQQRYSADNPISVTLSATNRSSVAASDIMRITGTTKKLNQPAIAWNRTAASWTGTITDLADVNVLSATFSKFSR